PLGYHSPLDPELAAEGGMCKVAVRSTFAPGAVTVTAASPGLASGTATFTTIALGTSAVVRPAAFSNKGLSSPIVKIEAVATTIRYYIGNRSLVGIEILDASGRMITMVSGSKQERGWHVLPLSDESRGGRTAAGLYVVRCMVDGVAYVKRVAIVR
ncbi:MAG TPA: hypothetical protein VKF42_05105, partial [Chitinivibrionales bacterium]|nr:hypothetical protein [Chitinivibrionales bacterium]